MSSSGAGAAERRNVSARLHRHHGDPAKVLRALDAVHVATALVYRERRAPDLVFATHDRRQARAAAALDFEVIGS